MAIYNLGSINVDNFYSVSHLPSPGETLAATDYRVGLGGKGANQSVAAAKAGSSVLHIGAVGPDGEWLLDRLKEHGVDTSGIVSVTKPTGHAIIYVDAVGENSIVLFSGANHALALKDIKAALSNAKNGDVLLLQNETSLQKEAAALAFEKGMSVVYSAAPFSVEAALKVMPYLSILVLNEIEASQLCAALETTLDAIEVSHILVTRGSDGADLYSKDASEVTHVSAHPTHVVDTTGAGDTYLGYFVAGLDQGMSKHDAMTLGSVAAALKIRSHGTSDAIPSRDAVEAARSGF